MHIYFTHTHTQGPHVALSETNEWQASEAVVLVVYWFVALVVTLQTLLTWEIRTSAMTY